MKKIFAFVLASLMVLSLVPASAFAAITKCPAVHTSTNCDCTKVKTVPSTCEKVGYTEYVCDTCGDSFVDNLTPKAEHTWVSNSKLAAGDVNASCVYQTNGVRYVVCAVCKLEKRQEISYNSTSVHNLVYVSGVGCEKLYACTLCDAEGYIAVDASGDTVLSTEVSHDWEFTKVDTEPYWSKGKAYSGLALYTCEECGAVKKVTIDTPVCHESNDATSLPPEDYTVVVKAKDPTCTAKGNRLVVKCADCGELWYCTNDFCASEHDEYEDHVWASADKDNDFDYKDSGDKKHETAKLNHYDEDGNKNGDTNNCGRSYWCVTCKTWQTEGHDYATLADVTGTPVIVNATCTTDGYQYRKCKDCGYIGKQTLDKTGHKKSGWIYVAATCASPAFRYKKCTNPDCTIVPTLINNVAVKVAEGIEYIGTPNANAHKWAPLGNGGLGSTQIGNLNPDLYCSGLTYEFKICENGCAEYGNGKAVLKDPVLHDLYTYSTAHNFNTIEDGFNAYSSQVVYACKNPACNYKSLPTVIPDTTITSTFDHIDDALEYYGFISRTWGYIDGELVCTSKPFRTKYAAETDFNADGVIDTKDLIAKYFLPLSGSFTSGATCQTPASTTYAVASLGTYFVIQGEKDRHIQKQVIAGTDATCTTPGAHTTYVCKNCGVTYWELDGKQYTTSAVKNPCYDDVEEVEGACGEESNYYKCKKCGTCYLDRECTTKYVPTTHNYVTLMPGVAATCNTTGALEIRYCADCNTLEVNLIYMNGGKELRVNFNTTGAKYGDKDVTIGTIDTAWLSATVNKPVTVRFDKDGTVVFDYDSDGANGTEEWYEWPSPVVVAKMENKYNHRGVYTNVEVNGAPVAVLATGIVASTNAFWANSEHDIDSDFEELDHTKPSFDFVYCDACVYEYIKNYIPAVGGHVNSDGKLIDLEACNDDAVCVVCAKYYNYDPFYADLYTFGAHDWKESAKVPASCVNAGYTAEHCAKCGEYKITTDSYITIDPDQYHANLAKQESLFPWMDSVKLVGTQEDYANAGSYYWACATCGKALTSLVKKDCPGVGVEFTLSADDQLYGPGSSIFVTVTIDSLKGVDVWGANFAVSYDTNAVKFVKAQIVNSAFTGTAYAPSEKQDMGNGLTQYVPTGLVNVALSSASGETIKGATDLVILEFKVDPIASYVNAAWFEIGSVHYGAVEEVVIGSNRKELKSMYNDTYLCEVELTSLADLDADGDTDMFDAFDLYYLIITDEYDVVADIDGDGQLTVDGDLALLYSYIVGETTIEEIINPPKEEESDRTYKYDENGLLIYDSYCDFNGNGVIDTVSEMAAFTGRIDPDQFWASQEK